MKDEKCEFEKTEIKYLGIIISQNSIAMDPTKVTRISEWPVPNKKRDLQAFLGFTNFYRRFIRDYSRVAR